MPVSIDTALVSAQTGQLLRQPRTFSPGFWKWPQHSRWSLTGSEEQMPEPTLGQAIEAARRNCRLSLEDLSEITERSVSYLSYLELDEIVPSKDRLKGISEALGLDPHFFEALRLQAASNPRPPQTPPA